MTERDWHADKALCDAAPPGPWTEDEDEHRRSNVIRSSKRDPVASIPIAGWDRKTQKALPMFIAEARTALPYWLRRVRELEDHIEEANANAPRSLVDALEALTDRSNQVDRLQAENNRLRDGLAKVPSLGVGQGHPWAEAALKTIGKTISRLERYSQEKLELIARLRGELAKRPSRVEIRAATEEACTCGGAGPGEGCPACEVYHRLLGRETRGGGEDEKS